MLVLLSSLGYTYEGEDKIVGIVIGVPLDEFGDRLDGSISDNSLIMRTESLKDGQDSRMLRSECRPDIGQFLRDREDNLVILFLDQVYS